YGKRLPLSTLFEAPTIERLAAILDDNKSLPTTSCLVPIQPRGSQPAFFCIHNPGGQVINYKQLAHHLGADQPFYGIQAQGLDGKQPIHTTVEEMAAHYMKEIQTFQPNGPYFLGGFCFGGQIAFEIARRLHAQGEKVALLALFEAFVRRYPPSMAPKNSPAVKLLPRLSQRAIFHTRRLRTMPSKERLSYLLKRATNAKILMHLALVRGLGRFCETLGLSLPRALQLRDVTLIHYQAGRTYVPQAYPGNAVLFLSQEMLESSAENPSIGWRRLVGGDLEVHKLECDHDDILLEPAVRSLAQTLRGYIVNSH
ncbi:MAG: thioesterase domain-containing protein, partial [Gammaproteobacteria bacterium]